MGEGRERSRQGDATETPREREATSGETLEEIERTQDSAASKSGGTTGESARTDNATPSPDGAFDSPRGGRADGSDAGEPM